jgi:hypothetical protein
MSPFDLTGERAWMIHDDSLEEHIELTLCVCTILPFWDAITPVGVEVDDDGIASFKIQAKTDDWVAWLFVDEVWLEQGDFVDVIDLDDLWEFLHKRRK